MGSSQPGSVNRNRERRAAIRRWASSLIGLCGLLLPSTFPADASDRVPDLRVPEGFVVERVAVEPELRFPMFATFDDRGRLFVAESSGGDLYAELRDQVRNCRIRLLEDRDGDGRFETATVFADELVFPMGLAWRDGRLYVADPPDLVILEDADSDGRADRCTPILSGFGHTDNGSLHGLVFGPDGWLYMTMGSPDGYRLERADGTVLEGRSGALIRCRPDGTQPEVLCRGFVNLIEVAFTPEGEILGTDNWFQRPAGGIRDALVHLVEGGLYPYEPDVGTPQPITGVPLPATALFPAVALSGLLRYKGRAFPEPMHGALFSAQFNARKVVLHRLIREGTSFRTEETDFVMTDDPDFHPSDVLEAADGSLLVVDTGSWYVDHCPTGRIRPTHAPGGLYRVRAAGAEAVADPWGRGIDWSGASAQRLAALLGDPRPAVADGAGRRLAALGAEAVTPLGQVYRGATDRRTRQRALWALSGIVAEAALEELQQALDDPCPEVAATAARALAVRGDRRAAPALARLLQAEEPHVRMAAAQALASCGELTTLPRLWEALTGPVDRFLEHALIHAAHRIAGAGELVAALGYPHPRVQKAALLLLDQPPRPREALEVSWVVERLGSADAELRETALQIVLRHPEWHEQAAGLLRDRLAEPLNSEPRRRALEGLILAFQADPAVQQLVAEAVAGPASRAPAMLRATLLEAMAQTHTELPGAWIDALARAVRDPDPAVRAAAVRAAVVLQEPRLDGPMTRLVEDPAESSPLRLEALRAVLPRHPELSSPVFALALERLGDAERPADRLAAAEVLGRSRLDAARLRRVLEVIRDDPLIARSVLLPAVAGPLDAGTAALLLDDLTAAVQAGWRPAAAELQPLWEAIPDAERPRAERLRELLRRVEAAQQARLAALEPVLKGGDPSRGRAVFFGTKAACATCHRLGDEGGPIGPDLTRIGAVRSGRDLLESIVLPGASFAQGYETYLVATDDGGLVGGILARQDAEALFLRDAAGIEVRVLRDRIQEMRRQEVSLMPEGLDRVLTREELRDLLAFLRSQD